MHAILQSAYQVVYYDDTGRQIYFPASKDSELLAAKLREARSQGLNARLSAAN
jgi:hypothetical protein